MWSLGLWDPDGPGPGTARLVVGGTYTWAGSGYASRIATWDPASGQWAPLGSGISGTVVRAILGLDNGDLVVGGSFAEAGGKVADSIARWDGNEWHPMGSLPVGLDGVRALATLDGSDVVAVAGLLHHWTGGAWRTQGVPLNGTVECLLHASSGDLLAGGSFTKAGEASMNYVARWDGAQWNALGPGMNNTVLAMAQLPSGDVVAGGVFFKAGGVPVSYAARWDGAAWSAIGNPGLGTRVNSLTALANGEIVASGGWNNTVHHIRRWTGAEWVSMGEGIPGSVLATTSLPTGEVIAAGFFSDAGDVGVNSIARWDGSAWSQLSPGFNRRIWTIKALDKPLGNYDTLAGGEFSGAGMANTRGIAAFDGKDWAALGTGITGAFKMDPPTVFAIEQIESGEVVAGGNFAAAGGQPANCVAMWDGQDWHALGPGMNDTVYALKELSGGPLMAAGLFTTAGGKSANYMAAWANGEWTPVGTGLKNGIRVLHSHSTGELVAGGYFSTTDGSPANHIARWNGALWVPLGNGLNDLVYALASAPNGDLIAGGTFGWPNSKVARWDGVSWSPIGNAPFEVARSIIPLQNGDLLVGGYTSIQRWNGST